MNDRQIITMVLMWITSFVLATAIPFAVNENIDHTHAPVIELVAIAIATAVTWVYLSVITRFQRGNASKCG